jgi:hypothetical protein
MQHRTPSDAGDDDERLRQTHREFLATVDTPSLVRELASRGNTHGHAEIAKILRAAATQSLVSELASRCPLLALAYTTPQAPTTPLQAFVGSMDEAEILVRGLQLQIDHGKIRRTRM